MYVCMHGCMYVCMYVWIDSWMDLSIYLSICAYIDRSIDFAYKCINDKNSAPIQRLQCRIPEKQSLMIDKNVGKNVPDVNI